MKTLFGIGTMAVFFTALAFLLPIVLRTTENVRSMTDFSYDSIESVCIVRPDEVLAFVRAPDAGWQFLDDPDFDLDRDRAVAVVNNCRYLSVRETLEDTGSLENFGLITPEYSLEITLKDGSERIFDVGAPTVDKRGRFALERGTHSIIVMQDFADRVFALPREKFFNRVPQPIRWDDALQMNISVKDLYDVALARENTKEPMRVIAPTIGYANPDALYDFNGRMTRFMFDDPVAFLRTSAEFSQYGLDAPSLVMMASDGENAFGILLGNRVDDDIYGMRAEAPTAVFRVAYAKVEWLFQQTDMSYVSRYLFYGNSAYGKEYGDIEIFLRKDEQSHALRVQPHGESFEFTMDGQPFPEDNAQQIVMQIAGLRLAGKRDGLWQADGKERIRMEARLSGLVVTHCAFYEYGRLHYAVDQGFGVYYLVRKADVDPFIALFESEAQP